jgi:hypothetical protein
MEFHRRHELEHAPDHLPLGKQTDRALGLGFHRYYETLRSLVQPKHVFLLASNIAELSGNST